MDTTSQVHQQQRRGGSTNQVRTEAANENVQLWIPRKSGLQFSHSFLFLRRVLPPSFPFFSFKHGGQHNSCAVARRAL